MSRATLRLNVRTAVIAAVVVLSVAMFAERAAAQTDFGAPPERYLKLDWQVDEHRGRPIIRGHVFNDHGLGARDIRILVEGLDPSGRVVTRSLGHVPFLVTPGTRAPFEVAVSQPAASYRVSVTSFGWVLPDDGRLFGRW